MIIKLNKIISLTIICISILFLGTYISAAPLVSNEDDIVNSVEFLVERGELEDFHLNYMNTDAYQVIYQESVSMTNSFFELKQLSEDDLIEKMEAYQEVNNETWDYIIGNLDIAVDSLDKDKILGIYWDAKHLENKNLSHLYLIWTSHYAPSKYLNIMNIKESGKQYQLYDTLSDETSRNGNWGQTDSYHYKDLDLSIHITPVSTINDGTQSGLPLKQKYSFEEFFYDLDDASTGADRDYFDGYQGVVTSPMQFDLGIIPSASSKSVMQLVTHSYELIKDCEVQTHYDINFGGYIHYVMFNTTISIDEIYRVDTAYRVTNDNRLWWQFFLRDESHQITKSLTPKKNQSGFLGLTTYQGFSEGKYASTVDGSKEYKYRLHLNYDENNWNIFEGLEYEEADFKRISEFQILKLNYLSDGTVYDVNISMDKIDGDSFWIFDKDLILDTNTTFYKIKNTIDDTIANIKESANVFLIVIATLTTVVVILVIARILGMIKLGINKSFEKPTANKTERK